jgi:hypothetical protein
LLLIRIPAPGSKADGLVNRLDWPESDCIAECTDPARIDVVRNKWCSYVHVLIPGHHLRPIHPPLAQWPAENHLEKRGGQAQ